MSSSDPVPSLAELRRGKRDRKSAEAPAMRGLFDAAPEPEGEAAGPAGRAETQIPFGDDHQKNRAQGQRQGQGQGQGQGQAKLAQGAGEAQKNSTHEQRVWTVGELVRQVRGLVERSYGQVSVEGEISNWRPAASGHCYFTLKDGAAQLSVVMFRRQASLIRFAAKDGDAVRLRGQLSVYESRGQMQLIAEWMEPRGMGALLAAVRELKEKLRREGLFDRKRPLPAFPRCIGVVTSVQGAALRDIVKVCRRRHAAVNLLIYPAAVQGPRCAAEVAAGLRWFSRHAERADVVIVARGGGSWEDLHGFDDERVARAIAGCAVPVIVGVGHATDTTIADAAADVCAPTPSAAAEMVTAAQHRVEERVERLRTRLERAGRFEMLQARQRMSQLSAEVVLRRVRDAVERRGQRIDELELRMMGALRRRVGAARERGMRAEARLLRQDPAVRLREDRRRLEAAEERLRGAATMVSERRGVRLERVGARLEALSPVRVLERGYALVYGPEGRLLRSSGEVRPGEVITARLAEGTVRAVGVALARMLGEAGRPVRVVLGMDTRE
ncbi:MAG TPA: exodeoxyribonuclease VII large subunit, partial [Acidobacteriaceae bacterium]|nr:exodeoxyribonuclease VII large subunit [Acidobacteriaceae bacterium]